MKSLKQLYIESEKKMILEEENISQGDLDFAEKIQDPTEKELWLKVVRLRNQYQKEKQQWQKRYWDKAYKELKKYRRNRTKKDFNISDIKKIFKQHGLGSVSFKSTAIRGFNRASGNSYKIDSFDPQNITLYGISKEKFNAIINELKEKGFKLENISEPSESLGGVNISHFRIIK